MSILPGWLRRALLGLCGAAFFDQAAVAQAAAWEPKQTIQLIVPASRGGGADQMARLIRDIAAKYRLASQPILVVNRTGHGGFTEIKAARGEPHTLLISLSNIFTGPLVSNLPVTWRDLTPVALVALDQFVLWVNADAPYKTVPEFLRAGKGTDPQQRFRMGGTGVRQEDEIIIQAIQRVSGAEFAYVAHRGGAEVASQLLAGNLEGSVNNPIEALPGWRAGGLRPLCVFNKKRLASTERPTMTMGWSDIPTCKEAGLDVEYEMVRTVFMAPGIEPAQSAYYIDLLQRVRETPEWKAYMQTGAYDTTFLTGEELRQRLAQEEERHRIIVSSGGLSIDTMQSNAPLGLGSAEHGNEN